MSASSGKTGILLLNLGGPTRLDEVEPFLYNIFSDPDVVQLPLGFLYQRAFARKMARARAPESRHTYSLIGGKSPILEKTREQARLLEERLGPEIVVEVGMRALSPTIEEGVRALLARGAVRIVALPCYPHYSRATTGSALRELRRVLRRTAPNLPLHTVCCYPTEPLFIEAWLEQIERTLSTVPSGPSGALGRRERAHLLFSAHGLPRRLIDRGDPYLRQLERTIGALIEYLPTHAYTLAFQSRATRIPWLGPSTQEALTALATHGHAGEPVEDVVVVPISFVTDHIETLYELDLLIRDHALAEGLSGYHRVAPPGASPRFIETLALLSLRALEQGRLCGTGTAGCAKIG